MTLPTATDAAEPEAGERRGPTSASTAVKASAPAALLGLGIAVHLLFLLSLRFGWLNPLFNDTMHRFGPGGDFFSIYAAALQPTWAERRPLFRSLGPVQSVELIEQTGTPAKPRLRYRMRYPSLTLLLLVTLDADGKITDLQAEEE